MGAGAKQMPGIITGANLRLGNMELSFIVLVTIAATVAVMMLLTLLVRKTKMGKAMRAVSEDMEAAQLMGISLNATISFTFAVGSALAGIGAVLYSSAYPQASPTMGSMLGLKAFVAAVWAASAPSRRHERRLAIGLLEALLRRGTSFLSTACFAILIDVLLVKRPNKGRDIREKV